MNDQLETRDILLISEQVRDFVSTNFLFSNAAVSFDDETPLLENGIIDETGALELVMFVEETYGIQVEEGDLVPENFDSVASISAFVAKHLAALRSDIGSEREE